MLTMGYAGALGHSYEAGLSWLGSLSQDLTSAALRAGVRDELAKGLTLLLRSRSTRVHHVLFLSAVIKLYSLFGAAMDLVIRTVHSERRHLPYSLGVLNLALC
jgi:hypothetical protein